MNCGNARELLSARLDGALSAAEAESLNEHLGSCEACRLHAADFEAVVDVVRGIPAPELSGSLAADIVAGLPVRRRPTPILWFAPLAAAACLVLLASLFLASPTAEHRLEVATGVDHGAAPAAEVADRERLETTLDSSPPRAAKEDAMGPPAPVSAPSADAGGTPDPATPRSGALGTAGGAGAPGNASGAKPEGAWSGEEPEKVTRQASVRTYRVRGAEPDSVAGVILAELRGRRSRARHAVDGVAAAGDARVVQDRTGEVAGMILDLTPSEIEFVTCLLVERPGVRIERVNGDRTNGGVREKKRDVSREKVADKPVDAAPEEPLAENGDDAAEKRVRVRLDFARK